MSLTKDFIEKEREFAEKEFFETNSEFSTAIRDLRRALDTYEKSYTQIIEQIENTKEDLDKIILALNK